MALISYPASGGSPIKSIQRGTAASSGAITISSINTSKSFCRSYSTSSAGSVGVTGTTSGTFSPSGGAGAQGGGSEQTQTGSWPSYSGTRTLAAGATALTSAEYGVYITDSTTITATGACKWEVVEYN
jgi:hypothetical protein